MGSPGRTELGVGIPPSGNMILNSASEMFKPEAAKAGGTLPSATN